MENNTYNLTHEHLTRLLEQAFEAGWRLRMNNKAFQCQELRDNAVYLIRLKLDEENKSTSTP